MELKEKYIKLIRSLFVTDKEGSLFTKISDFEGIAKKCEKIAIEYAKQEYGRGFKEGLKVGLPTPEELIEEIRRDVSANRQTF